MKLDLWGVRPNGAGGWFVTGNEPWSDGELHVELSDVDAKGSGRRLGCSPRGGGWAITPAAAVAPDAYYLIVGYPTQLGSYDYFVVKVAR